MMQRLSAAALLLATVSNGASAQSVESFYAGRTVELIVGAPPGGGYDLFARPVAQLLGRHMPGRAAVVIKYMPGAGTIVASNHLYNVALRDGTVLGIVSPTSPLDARLNPSTVKFDAVKFNWLGRIAPQPFVAGLWNTTPVRTIDDARATEVTFAGTGLGSGIVAYPMVTNRVLGTRFKMVLGYKGSADSLLAMERGEVQAHASGMELFTSQRRDWLSSGKVHLLLQYGLKRHPTLPDVPTVIEHARTLEEENVLRAVMSAVEIGRAVLTTPGVPHDRVAALRKAFDALMTDPDFIAELTKVGMQVLPLSGDAVHRMVREVSEMPDTLVEKVRAAYAQ